MKRKKFRKEKKVKVVPEGNVVEFDFEKIKRLAEENGIKAYLKADGTVIEFKSQYGSWISTVSRGMEFIKLYHDVKDGKRHLQNVFFDFNFLCKSTHDHDWYKTKRKGGNSVDYVFEKYNNGLIPRFKAN